MSRMKWLLAGAIVVSVTTLALARAKAPTIEEIMEKCHATKKGLRDVIKEKAAKPKPDWTDIQKKTKEFVTLASDLEKNDPPKGDKAAWKKLSQDYVKQVKDLDSAAGKKDSKAVEGSIKTLGANCKGCHDNHRE